MKLTANAAMSTRASAMKLGGFSKMWQVNDQGIVFYPIVKDPVTGVYDLLVGAVWGHQIDMQALGLKSTFIPTTSEINERGEPVNPDITYQFSRIAKCFVDGMKEKEKAEVNSKDWSAMPAAALASALEAVEKKYDVKNNMKAIGPAVKRLSYLVTTECVYVPVENDKPQPDKARLVTRNLSNDHIAKLQALLNNSAYRPDTSIGEDGQPKENWLEVSYTFTSARNDKAEAGRAAPMGVSPDMRMSRRFPEQWTILRPRLNDLPEDSDTIANRNYSYRALPESAVRNALRAYAVMNSGYLSSLTEEGQEVLLRNAAAIDSMCIKVKDPELQAKMDKAVEEYKAAQSQTQSQNDNDLPFTMGGSAIDQELKRTGAPSLEDLMRGRTEQDGTEYGADVGDDGAEAVEL